MTKKEWKSKGIKVSYRRIEKLTSLMSEEMKEVFLDVPNCNKKSFCKMCRSISPAIAYDVARRMRLIKLAFATPYFHDTMITFQFSFDHIDFESMKEEVEA